MREQQLAIWRGFQIFPGLDYSLESRGLSFRRTRLCLLTTYCNRLLLRANEAMDPSFRRESGWRLPMDRPSVSSVVRCQPEATQSR